MQGTDRVTYLTNDQPYCSHQGFENLHQGLELKLGALFFGGRGFVVFRYIMASQIGRSFEALHFQRGRTLSSLPLVSSDQSPTTD